MEIEKKNSIDMSLLIISMVLFFPAVSGYIRAVILRIIGIFGFTFTQQEFDIFVWILIIILPIQWWIVNLNGKNIVFYLGACGIVFLMHALSLSEALTFERMLALCFMIMPAFLCAVVLKENVFQNKWLYRLAFAVLLISAIYQLFSLSGSGVIAEDNMDFAYKILPSVLIMIAGPFNSNDNRILRIAVAILSVVFLMVQGTRGPLLCAVVFLFLLLFKKFGMTRLVISLLVVLILLGIVFSIPIVQNALLNMVDKIESLGFSARFITMLIEGDIVDDNGRGEIAEILTNEIRNNPFLFRGLFADRIVLDGVASEGKYAHNLILEVMIDFGVILGALFLIILLWFVYKLIKNCKFEQCMIVAIGICCGLVHLFMSGSFVQNSMFYFLLGLCFNKNIVSNQNQRVINEDSGN